MPAARTRPWPLLNKFFGARARPGANRRYHAEPVKTLRNLTALGAFFVVAALIAGCGSNVPGGSVASVAGNPITLQAFNHWMYINQKANAAEEGETTGVIVPNDPPEFNACIKQVKTEYPTLAKYSTKELRTECQSLFTSLSSTVMNYLIESYWFQAEAYRKGIHVSDAEIQKILAQQKAAEFKTDTEAEYKAFLAETGQTEQDVLFRVRVNQLYKLLIAKETQPVTAAAIKAYYEAHKSQLGTPETRNIRIVLTNNEGQANAALAALKSGQSWQAVAKKFSIDPTTRNQGGLLTGVEEGQEDKALNNAAFAASAGKIEGPVHGTFGWYVFEVEKINPGTHPSLAEATPSIRSTLKSNFASAAQTQVLSTAKKNWGSQTFCAQYYEVSLCHNYTPTTTTTTSQQTTATTTATGASTSTTGTARTTTSTPATSTKTTG